MVDIATRSVSDYMERPKRTNNLRGKAVSSIFSAPSASRPPPTLLPLDGVASAAGPTLIQPWETTSLPSSSATELLRSVRSVAKME
jgi:hypothetical protein